MKETWCSSVTEKGLDICFPSVQQCTNITIPSQSGNKKLGTLSDFRLHRGSSHFLGIFASRGSTCTKLTWPSRQYVVMSKNNPQEAGNQCSAEGKSSSSSRILLGYTISTVNLCYSRDHAASLLPWFPKKRGIGNSLQPTCKLRQVSDT